VELALPALVAVVRPGFVTNHEIVGLLQREQVLYVSAKSRPAGVALLM
jgi:hypothetical protein